MTKKKRKEKYDNSIQLNIVRIYAAMKSDICTHYVNCICSQIPQVPDEKVLEEEQVA